MKKKEFGPIKTVSLNNECYAQIKEAIFTGRYSWGERIDINKIAEEFKISKFPIIKAINRLELEHLVTILPNKGSFVATPTLHDIKEINEVRLMLECTSFDLACTKNLPALLATLNEINREFSSQYKSFNQGKEQGAFLEYDRKFHFSFMTHSNNKRLYDMYEITRNQELLFRAKLFNKENVHVAIQDHDEIHSYLKKNKIVEAKKTLLLHIERVQDQEAQMFLSFKQPAT